MRVKHHFNQHGFVFNWACAAGGEVVSGVCTLVCLPWVLLVICFKHFSYFFMDHSRLSPLVACFDDLCQRRGSIFEHLALLYLVSVVDVEGRDVQVKRLVVLVSTDDLAEFKQQRGA